MICVFVPMVDSLIAETLLRREQNDGADRNHAAPATHGRGNYGRAIAAPKGAAQARLVAQAPLSPPFNLGHDSRLAVT